MTSMQVTDHVQEGNVLTLMMDFVTNIGAARAAEPKKRRLTRTLTSLNRTQVADHLKSSGFADLVDSFVEDGVDGNVLSVSDMEDLDEFNAFRSMKGARKKSFVKQLKSWRDQGIASAQAPSEL